MADTSAAHPRLTVHDQLLVNLCGWLSNCWSDDANLRLMLDQLRRVLPHVNYDHPSVARLADAGAALLLVIRHPEDHRNLSACHEHFALRAALQPIFMTRAAQAAAAIWPEENTQATATASEPAHAAE